MADNSFIASILAKLDTSQIKADLNKVQKMMDDNPGKVQASIDSAQIKQQIASISKSLSESLKLEGIDINSAKIQTQLSSVISQIQNKDKIQLKVDLNKENLLSNMKAFASSNTKLFASTSTKAKELQAEFVTLKKKIADAGDGTELSGLSKELSTLKNNVKATGLATNSVFTTFKEDLGKFAEFYLAGGITTGTIASITSIIDNVKKLDTAIVDLQMATGDSYSDVSNLMDSYIAMGKELGASATDVAASASDWLRQGKSIEDTNTLIKDSMVLSKDGQIESADATTYLTTATKGYNVAVGDTIGIVDKLTAVDLISATSAGGLAEAMSQTANNANLAGVSMDKLLGYLAVVGETTGASMSSVGNSFSTIFSRMSNIKLKALSDPESAKDLNNVETSLKNVGIALRSDNSTFRNLDDVLDDTAGKWNTMSEVNQRAIAVSIAGKDHMEDFLVLMNNYAKAQEYTTAATNSSGTAMEKFSAYEDSIQARTERLTATMQGLSKDILNSGIVKTTLDGLNLAGAGVDELVKKVGLLGIAIPTVAIIAFVKNLKELQQLGKTVDVFSGLKNVADITATTEGITTLKAAYSGLTDKQILAKLATSGLTDAQKAQVISLVATEGATSALATKEGVATATTGGLSTAFKGLGVAAKEAFIALATNPITWIAVAIAGIIALYNHIQDVRAISDNANAKLKEQLQTYQTAESELDTLNGKLSDTQKQMSDLQAKGSLTLVEQTQLDALSQTNEDLKTQIALKKQQVALEAQKTASDAVNDYNKATTGYNIFGKTGSTVASEDAINSYIKSFSADTAGSGMAISGESIKASKDDINYLLAAYDELYKKKAQIQSQITDLDGKDDTESNKVRDRLKAQLQEIDGYYGTVSGDVSDYQSKMSDVKTSLETLQSAGVDLDDTQKQALQGAIDGLSIISNEVGKTTLKYEDMNEAQKKSYVQSKLLSNSSNNSDDVKKFVNGLSDSDLSLIGNITFDDASTIDSTKKAMKEAQDEANKNPVTSNLTVDFTDPTDLLTQLKSLTDHASMLADVKKEMAESGTIGVDSLQKISAAYDAMKPYIAQYMQELISTEDLFNDLQNVYQTDANNYLNAVAEKDATDGTFFKDLLNANVDWVNQFKDDYGIDLNNYGSLAEAKAAIDSKLLQALSSNWNGYYNAQKDAITGLYTLTSNYGSDDSDEISPEQEAARVQQQDAYAKYNQMMTDLNNTTAGFESAKIDVSWQGLSDYDSSSAGSSGSNSSSEAKQTAKDYDMIAIAISRVEANIKSLGNVVNDTSRTWSERNAALLKEMGSTASEIDSQKKAYSEYMELADQTGLADPFRDMIQNGSIEVFTTTDEALQNQIDTYKDYYEKAMSCADAVQTLTEKLSELVQTNFDNAKTQLEGIATAFQNDVTYMKDAISQRELKSSIGDSALIKGAMVYQTEYIQRLQDEISGLTTQFNNGLANGAITEGSEAFNKMQSEIDSVTNALMEATTELNSYAISLQKIKWDLFDRARDSVAGLVSETDTLIDLLGSDNLTNTDGTLNTNGLTKQGLLVQDYDLYMKQAEAYGKEVKKIDSEIANDPSNTTLIDRRKTLLDAQQSAIKSANEEKSAIKSLISDSYQAQIKSLSTIIDKYKTLLSTAKDAYSYQKSIKEKSSNILSLQKQYEVAQSDTSEEGRKTAQQLKVQLETAKSDLQDTQYDKLVSDTEKILDDLETNFESALNAQLQNIDATLEKAITDSNTNSSVIASNLKDLAKQFGYTLSDSMTSIWGTKGAALTDFNTSVVTGQSAIQKVLEGIEASISKLLVGQNWNQVGNSWYYLNDDGSYKRNSWVQDNNKWYYLDSSGKMESNQWQKSGDKWYYLGANGDMAANQWQKYNDKWYYLDSSGAMETNQWQKYKDKWYYMDSTGAMMSDSWTKYNDKWYYLQSDGSMAKSGWQLTNGYWYYLQSDGSMATNQYVKDKNSGMYYWVNGQGAWESQWNTTKPDLTKYKVAYANGTQNATAGRALYDENGLNSELLMTKEGVIRQFDAKETVFDAAARSNLWDFSQDPAKYISGLRSSIPTPTAVFSNNQKTNVTIDFSNMTLHDVHDVKTFCSMLAEPKIQAQIQDLTLGQALGNNSLEIRKYI